MAYQSAYTGPEIDGAVGTVKQKETTWDGKQDKITGQQGQIVGFDSNGDPVAQTAPDTGVVTFNGRTGAVTPQSGDYTADMVGARSNTWTPSAADVGAVPTDRTVNGKALSQNITLTADDVGARANTWMPTASDVGAVPTARTVNGKALSADISLTAADVGARASTWLPTPAEIGAATPAVAKTVTLYSSGWSSNSQTVTVTGVVADTNAQAIDVSPVSKTDADNWAQAGVWCTAQGANTLTFTCTEVPSANINVNVKIQEV